MTPCVRTPIASAALDVSRPMGTADLERRTITAIVYAVVVLAALFAPWPVFAALVAILALLAYVELRGLFRYRSYQPWTLGVLTTLAFVGAHLIDRGTGVVGLSVTGPVMVLVIVTAFGVLTIVALLAQVARHQPTPRILGAVFTLAGSIYIGLGLGFLIRLWIANGSATRGWLGDLPVWLLLALVPTWVGDSTAYLVGSRIGRRRITPTISPGKTWEGTLAGFAAAGVVALLIAVSAGMKTGPALLVAVLVGPVGFGGDLFESGIKRVAGAKDSGTLFPGHGGVLDRIDSLIFVAPAVALVLALARG